MISMIYIKNLYGATNDRYQQGWFTRKMAIRPVSTLSKSVVLVSTERTSDTLTKSLCVINSLLTYLLTSSSHRKN